jgi:Protein of unknown function (DUF2946)
MEKIRSSKLIARFVLVWFVLFVGIAAASPIVHPQETGVVCSSSGTHWVDAGDNSDGSSGKAHSTLDCPLCVLVVAPPPIVELSFELTSPLAHALQPVVQARIVALTAPPLPSRGPPLS